QGARCRAAVPGPGPDAQPDRVRLVEHDSANVPVVGSRGARRVLRPGGRDFAAQLLREHAGTDRQRCVAVSGNEPRYGTPDSRDRGGLRLRASAAEIAEEVVAFL